MASVRISVTYSDGSPAAGLEVWAVPAPSATILLAGERIKASPPCGKTNAKGELVFQMTPMLPAQALNLFAKTHKLMLLDDADDAVPVISTSTLPRLFNRVLLAEAVRIAPTVSSRKFRLVARRMYFLECVHCGQKFRTVERADADVNRCPNDNQSFALLENTVRAEPNSFLQATGGQDPQANPNTITSRGFTSLMTAAGSVPVFWDESRFVRANQIRY